MHDPSTQAFVIPNPFTGRKVSWKPGRYYEPLITIWHVDPEKRGDDDSCDWSGWRSLTDAEREWLVKEGEQEHGYMIRGVAKCDESKDGRLTPNTRGEYWPGGMIHASALELLYGIWTVILWRMPHNGKKLHERWLSRWRMRRGLAQALPRLLNMVSNPNDNLHAQIAAACAVDASGKKAMGELFAAVYRIMKGEDRPWWRHPRWHLHHWSLQVHPWQNLRRWVMDRCYACTRRFRWGEAPVRNSHGLHHLSCTDKVRGVTP